METALSHFVFHPTTTLLAQVAQHLRQHLFQSYIGHRRLLGIRLGLLLDGEIAVVGDVESRAVHVATVLGGVAVVATKPSDILLRTQYAGDDNLMRLQSLNLQTIKEVTTNVLK